MRKRWKYILVFTLFLFLSMVWAIKVYDVNKNHSSEYSVTCVDAGHTVEIDGLGIKCIDLAIYDNVAFWKEYENFFSIDMYKLMKDTGDPYVETEKKIVARFEITNTTDRYVDVNQEGLFFWGFKERAFFNGVDMSYTTNELYTEEGLAPGETTVATYWTSASMRFYNEDDYEDLHNKEFTFCLVDENNADNKRITYEIAIGKPRNVEGSEEDILAFKEACENPSYSDITDDDIAHEDDTEDILVEKPEDTPKDIQLVMGDELVFNGVGYRIISGFVADDISQFPEYADDTKHWNMERVPLVGDERYPFMIDVQYLFLEMEITNYNASSQYMRANAKVSQYRSDIGDIPYASRSDSWSYFDKCEWTIEDDPDGSRFSYFNIDSGEKIHTVVCYRISIEAKDDDPLDYDIFEGGISKEDELYFVMEPTNTIIDYEGQDVTQKILDAMRVIKLDKLEWRTEREW